MTDFEAKARALYNDIARWQRSGEAEQFTLEGIAAALAEAAREEREGVDRLLDKAYIVARAEGFAAGVEAADGLRIALADCLAYMEGGISERLFYARVVEDGHAALVRALAAPERKEGK